MKLWQGRFDGPTAGNADKFNDSLPFDKALWREDIEASEAHARMLGRQGIIPEEDAESIISGLEGIARDIGSGKTEISGAEDVHSFMENELVSRIGDAGKRLHTARSRNDQVATDMRLYARGAFDRLTGSLLRLIGALADRAEENKGAVMPGYTHLRKAQPVSCGHFFDAYAEMFLRDADRAAQSRARANVCPLGSGALAGTSYPVDRDFVCGELGFDGPCANSMDGVSDRDFCAEFAFDCSLAMSHLSRLCEDLIIYSSPEFGLFEIPDEYSTGSSIMPQKKNPDICELVRGKTGRAYGYLTDVLTVLKGIPLAYDKDLQEDKEGFFDCERNTLSCLDITAELIGALRVDTARAAAAADEDFCCATDVADYLARRGVPFRTAHSVTGAIVRSCLEGGKTLGDLTADEFRAFSPEFGDDIVGVVDARSCADARSSFGGGSEASVDENVRSIRERMKKYGEA